MFRAIFFDFYGVWAPSRLTAYIAKVRQFDQKIADELIEAQKQYYFGLVDNEYLINRIKFGLNITDIDPATFSVREADISPDAIKFIQSLHGHFLKVGMLANMGSSDYKMLEDLNSKYNLFENITGSCNFGVPLLTTEVFAKALQDIGEPKAACLIITADSEYLKFAESLGIKTLRYEGFPKLTETIGQLLENYQTS